MVSLGAELIDLGLGTETAEEVENFFDLFDKYVDDVSVNQYTERGGKISDLTDLELKKPSTTRAKKDFITS